MFPQKHIRNPSSTKLVLTQTYKVWLVPTQSYEVGLKIFFDVIYDDQTCPQVLVIDDDQVCPQAWSSERDPHC